jgi:hypothetical protein
LLARELIRQGQGDWRAAVTLLEYGSSLGDFQAALKALEALIKGAPPPQAWALYRLGAGYGDKFSAFGLALMEPAGPPPPEMAHPEAEPTAASPPQAGPASPEVPFDPEEAQRLQAVVRRLVAETATRETLRNPEDLERDALEALAQDPNSLFSRYPAEQERRAYQETYRGVIDRSLAEETLGQHYAPELKEMFTDDGLEALSLVVQAAVAY